MADGCTYCPASPGGSGVGAGPQPASTMFPINPVPTVTPFTTSPRSPTGIPSTSNGGSAVAPRPTTLAPPAKDCKADLSSTFHYPSLMVPVDLASPDKAYGSTSYGQVSPNASTLYNFDISASDAGKSCKVFFAMPSQSVLRNAQGSDYYFSGDGSVVFSRMGTLANQATTLNDVAQMGRKDLGAVKLSPGNNYVIETFDCSNAIGAGVSYMIAEPVGRDTCLIYYQESAPVSVGLFISTC